MTPDRRREFSGLRELVAHGWRIARDGRNTARALSPRHLDPLLRERIMLAVSAVNGCRWCTWGHARLALLAGIPAEEVEALKAGGLEGAPDDQIPALLYAQHWADTDGHPHPLARAAMLAALGEERTALLEAAIRLIAFGNLLGNSFDRLLCRASGGRFGCHSVGARR